MYKMKQEYMTGITFVDTEHTRLFNIADELYELLKNDFIHDKYDDTIRVLDELVDYTIGHFAHEEQYMKEIGYKRLISHISEHNEFKEQLALFDQTTVDKNPQQTLLQLLEFVNNWLIHHICETDKTLALHTK